MLQLPFGQFRLSASGHTHFEEFPWNSSHASTALRAVPALRIRSRPRYYGECKQAVQRHLATIFYKNS
jgi:hypothetical protein